MILTEQEAEKYPCIGPDNCGKRHVGGGLRNCAGSSCGMAWRWVPLMADEQFMAAVEKAASDIGDKTPNRSKAAKHVVANRAEYGLPTKPFRGYCGLAGKVE